MAIIKVSYLVIKDTGVTGGEALCSLWNAMVFLLYGVFSKTNIVNDIICSILRSPLLPFNIEYFFCYDRKQSSPPLKRYRRRDSSGSDVSDSDDDDERNKSSSSSYRQSASNRSVNRGTCYC